jgi:SAM-dependent methyltransferase/Zn ribbon nucleic-acid-binding protein
VKHSLVASLRCPQCKSELSLADAEWQNDEVESGALNCSGCGAAHPIVVGIPRFVPLDNYAENFGFQWNRFRRTQLDSHSGQTISRDRFLKSTGWTPESLAGQTVLDIGCGAGRFVEVALSCGATVFALDYSRAVDACRANFPTRPNLHVVQGDVYALPFADECFDAIYCLGVLQHTPDPRQAFLSLPRHLKTGGRLAVDIYQGGWRRALHTKYWVRPVTTRLPQERLFQAVERGMPALMGLSRAVSRIPALGRYARRLLPIANYDGLYGLNEQQLREWAVLDTFDMLAPAYDRPQTPRALAQWTQHAGLAGVEIGQFGHLVARGHKPAA